MGTELETTMHEHTLKQFWGGDERGVCVQITSTSGVDDEGFVCLTMEEAAALCGDLISFVKAEAIRRQRLLKKQIEQMRLCERTVFNEIAELPADLISADELVVTMVSRFCPKTPNAELSGGCKPSA